MTSARVLSLTVGPMTHGGHCIARHDDRVVFLRHAVPGEQVRAVVTEGDDASRFWRADVIDVLEPSDHRRRHPWKQADSLRAYDHNHVPVGGADYGHISDSHQRRLKSHVFRDTMSRIGHIDLSTLELPGLSTDGEVAVAALPGATAGGLHWRTRVNFAVAGSSLAMRPHRSHDLIALRSMPLAVESVGDAHLFSWDFTGASAVDVVAPGGTGPLSLVVRSESADAQSLRERIIAQATEDRSVASVTLAVPEVAHDSRTPSVGSGKQGRHGTGSSRRRRQRPPVNQPVTVRYETLLGHPDIQEPLPVSVAAEAGFSDRVTLPAESFWQIHRSAPQALTDTVDSMLSLAEGDTAVDLYAGAGLFTALCARRVGPSGQVLSVEAAEGSSRAAGHLFAEHPEVEVVTAPVERVVDRLRQVHTVVLDPPRAGADPRVLRGIDAAAPREVVYVSCDPASFARDARVLLELGWVLRRVELLDMYPNTHHMESVALFQRHSSH